MQSQVVSKNKKCRVSTFTNNRKEPFQICLLYHYAPILSKPKIFSLHITYVLENDFSDEYDTLAKWIAVTNDKAIATTIIVNATILSLGPTFFLVSLLSFLSWRLLNYSYCR